MSESFRTSIRLKLAGLVGLVVVCALVALGVGTYLVTRNALRAQIHDRLSVVASDRQKLLTGYIQQQEERIALIASRTRLRQLLDDVARGRVAPEQFREDSRAILLDAQGSSPGLLGIWITDAAGHVLTATDAQYLGRDYAKLPVFAGAAGGPQFHLVRSAGKEQALVTTPARVEPDRLVGIVMMLVDAEPIIHVLADPTGLGATGEFMVGTREGDTIRYLLAKEAGTFSTTVPLDRAPAMGNAIAGQTGFRQTRDRRGVEVLAAYRPVGHRDWGLVAKIDVAEAYAPVVWLRQLFLGVGLVILALGLLSSYWLARRVTNPILRMASMARSMASGGMQARVVVESSDELGALATAFNQMTEESAHAHALLEDSVRERTEELQAERDMLQQLMDRSPDRIYFKDLQSRFIRVNKPLAEFFGAAGLAAILGKTDFDVFSQEHAEQAFADEQQIMRTGQPMMGKEEKETWPDGRVTWASSTKAPLRDREGHVIGTFGISRDVTARRLAEEELNRYFTLSPDLFCIADYAGYFKRLNPTWEQTFGYSTAELLAQPFLNFVHPDDQAATRAEFEKVLRGQAVRGFENRYRSKDGAYRWLQWSAIPQPDQRIVHAVARDVSEHKRAQELLNRFAQALNQKNQEMQEDLQMAREVQLAFLPQRFPTFPKGARPEASALKFHTRYLTTSTLGGDFFDILPLSDTEAGIFICDVMGHGTRAALVTAIVRGLVDELLPFAGDPGQFLTEINQALQTNLKSMSTTIFASACYAVVDATTGTVLCANAGHPSPLCLRPASRVVERCPGISEIHGPALGLIKGHIYKTGRFTLAARDTLLLFTDGLYEVEVAGGDIFGQERIEAAVRQRVQSPGGQLVEELVAEVKRYAVKGEFTDDVCLVGVELAHLVPAPPRASHPQPSAT